ncbi:hypothetical protein ACWGCP_40960, partial [Streptomyces niveus]
GRATPVTSTKPVVQPPYCASATALLAARGSGRLGTGTARAEAPAPEPAPAVNEKPLPPVAPPHVPPARPYQDTQAEELDVPDFLK